MVTISHRVAQRHFLQFAINLARSHLEILKDWRSIDLIADSFGLALSPQESKIIIKFLQERFG